MIAQTISITKRTPPPTPRPTPAPTPQPTPKLTPTPQPHYSLAPKVVVRAPAAKAAAVPTKRIGGKAARHVLVAQTPRPIQAVPNRPARSIARGSGTGVANGGAGTGAGAGIGTGGLGGAGSGLGTAGSGNGGDISTAPCGDVYLEPGQINYRRDGTVLQNVLAKIVTRDGSVSIAPFPWPFVYPGEKDNPFVHDEALHGHDGVPVQPPPPGTDLTTLAPAIQVVLKHTDPATGKTTFPACTPY